MGRTGPSLIERGGGDVPDKLIDGTDRPVLVVRKPESEDEHEAV